ncbi:MAG: DUF3467 domain-containing protein [Bryobacteraceae bacterium]|jgi:hypothetical protein
MATKKKRAAAPAQAQTMRFLRPENYPVIYANNVQISISNWDFRLDFGEINPPLPGTEGDNTVTQKVGILMTPGIAEALAKILEHYGKIYKEQFANQEWKPPTT